jgi:hypothetical protein
MTAKTIIGQAKAFLQVTTILISVGLVPIMVGTLGRAIAPHQAMTALDPQTVGPVFPW